MRGVEQPTKRIVAMMVTVLAENKKPPDLPGGF